MLAYSYLGKENVKLQDNALFLLIFMHKEIGDVFLNISFGQQKYLLEELL